MSVKGSVETRCPKKCEPFTAEIWTIIQGEKSPNLREAAAANECNLLVCPGCGKPFFPQEPFVYIEPGAEITAVVLPESYRGQEDYWRKKLMDDFRQLNELPEAQGDLEPDIFIGSAGLAELLQGEDYRHEEGEVMEAFAAKLGLKVYRTSAKAARAKGLPRLMPLAPVKSEGLRERLVEGLKRLVKANDALTTYNGYLEELLARPEEPPLPEDQGRGS